jgi:tRNA threonylcarbamoyl adenosine modification protein YeaZ
VLVLAFDTATPAVTVALHDAERVLASSTNVDARRQGELLATGIEAVLREAGCQMADVTRVVVGAGPGPFTGLRVGLMTARALGDALSVPVDGVCSLDVLAAAVKPDEPFLVATDARRKEVYWATYGADGRRLSGPAVDLPAAIQWSGPVVGAGGALYADHFVDVRDPLYPDAAVLAGMVVAGRAELIAPEPLYLRRPDAERPGPRKQVTPA